MKTNHKYRYYFKNQILIWCSDLCEDLEAILLGDDSLNWELTVIGVSLGHTMEQKKRLIFQKGDFFWMEQNIIPIFEGERVCGLEGLITVEKKWAHIRGP